MCAIFLEYIQCSCGWKCYEMQLHVISLTLVVWQNVSALMDLSKATLHEHYPLRMNGEGCYKVNAQIMLQNIQRAYKVYKYALWKTMTPMTWMTQVSEFKRYNVKSTKLSAYNNKLKQFVLFLANEILIWMQIKYKLKWFFVYQITYMYNL